MILILFLKTLFDGVYQAVGVVDSTNWTVMYRFFDYLAYSSIYMYVAFRMDLVKPLPKMIKNHRGFISFILNAFGALYLAYAFIELTYFNMDYEDYTCAMMEGNLEINQSVAMLFALLVYVTTYQLKKTNKMYLWI